MIINSATTWMQLQSQLNVNQILILQYAPPQTFFERVSSAFTGQTPVTDKVYSLILAKIRDHIHDKSPEGSAIADVAAQLLRDTGVDYKDLNSTQAIRKVFQRIDNKAIEIIGSEASVYDLALKLERSPQNDAENMLKLLMGAQFTLEIFSTELLRGILVMKNPALMAAFRDALQKAMMIAFDQLNTSQLTPHQEKLHEIFVGNLLVLVPFTEPPKGFKLTVPQKIDKQWHAVPYAVETLEMNPDWLGGVIPALGLKPQINLKASPLLLFRGTPHPTASGFLAAILADSYPGYSVGEYIYKHYAHTTIQTWMNSVKSKVKLYGQSLGGSLCLFTMIDHLDRIAEVNLFGSPTLEERAKQVCDERWNACQDRPSVNMYWNNGDLIPYTGLGFHPDWNVYKIFTPEKQWSMHAHGSLNAVRPKAIFLKIDPINDSRSILRKIMNIFYKIVLTIMFVGVVTLIALRILGLYMLSKITELRKKTKPLTEPDSPV